MAAPLKHKFTNLAEPENMLVDLEPPKRDLPTMPPGQVDHHLKSVAGRILTLIDGAIPDARQNKALKTLIKKEFREEFNRTFRYLYSDARSTEGSDEAAVYDQ